MYRIAIEKLFKWKQSKRRKPLIIEGARQVGKTWLMKEFGRQAYEDTVYINFDSNSRMAELFAPDLDTERLIMGLELYAGRCRWTTTRSPGRMPAFSMDSPRTRRAKYSPVRPPVSKVR